nr:MAG TPA: hypothetical protein [Caudoviricetes sp.]DAZ26607.1 MAG TPA: hypothetical protein [Caudoviricetes sp.]
MTLLDFSSGVSMSQCLTKTKSKQRRKYNDDIKG